ncbi:hypothetical protein LCGC14_1176120 [marine sediment metagenome]|uniref:Uncharacterized protein n=1 Tax=marine sediment metagenome TaxID=412755 RepID=A0A0F9PTW0_9ZZZZ
MGIKSTKEKIKSTDEIIKIILERSKDLKYLSKNITPPKLKSTRLLR